MTIRARGPAKPPFAGIPCDVAGAPAERTNLMEHAIITYSGPGNVGFNNGQQPSQILTIRPVNKDQEIQRIKSFAESLGRDSYTGPWLLSQIPGIEADIRSDLAPMNSYQEDRAFRQLLCDQARETAVGIKAEATRERDRILAEASRLVKSERDQLATLCRNILAKIT